jgi:phosphomannomutase
MTSEAFKVMKTSKISHLMTETKVQFGTSGIRGLVESMSDELCFVYTLAFVKALNIQSGQRVAIATDLRPSSPRIANACMHALKSMKINADFYGSIPTPALAYFAQLEKIPAIMITGSHIPFDRNGIKFYSAQGEITKEHEAAITSSEIAYDFSTINESLPEVNPEAFDIYIGRYLSIFPNDYFKGVKIGFYEHSSVARELISTLLKKLGVDVISLGRTDEFVPIDTEAVSDEDILRAKNWAKTHNFDAIISTDGDADRPLIGDENGQWLRGDIVGLLTSQYLGIKAISTPVSCNTAIEKSNLFRAVKRTRIGSPYVIEAINYLVQNSSNSVAGFEANGGYLLGTEIKTEFGFLQPLCTRDAVLPILAVLALAKQNRCKVSELIKQLPLRMTASDRIQNFPTEKSKAYLSKLADENSLREFLRNDFGGYQSFDLTDGLRVLLDTGDFIHFRPSGNAPEIRCYAESDSDEKARALVSKALMLFKTYAQ